MYSIVTRLMLQENIAKRHALFLRQKKDAGYCHIHSNTRYYTFAQCRYLELHLANNIANGLQNGLHTF